MAFMMIFIHLTAQAQVKFSGEIRPRTEYSHGYGSLADTDQDPSLFTSQRTRLNVNYKNDVFQTHFVLQDVRTWGNQSQLVRNEDYATSIHEAWGEIFFSPEWSLKLGRQELAYDNHRIFGNVGWAQQARSHDLFLLKYKGPWEIHVGIAFNQNEERDNNFYETPGNYKALQYAWFNKKMEKFSLSLLFLNNGMPYAKEWDENDIMTKQGIRYSQTMGGYIATTREDWNLSGSLYFQTGQINYWSEERKLRAFQLSIDATHTVNDKSHVGAGYELLSGTHYKDLGNDNEKIHSFAPLYGTNHKFNGFMDYFYVGNHFNNAGLHDLYIKGDIKPGKVKLNGALHFFNSYAKVHEDAKKHLGTELDLWMGYSFKKMVLINAGYSQMFAGKTMEKLKGGDRGVIQNWAWVMLTFKPTFFEQ
ncbi:hypothetical protein DMA11_12875 [Marinilabiliaceae bacterium JC017]|nr:hypothetical protein DMA11_12875 [Marinilabiliaceae bacterium JC017]